MRIFSFPVMPAQAGAQACSNVPTRLGSRFRAREEMPLAVMPAKAGIHERHGMSVDSRFRGNDGSGVSRFLHTLFLGDDDKARGCFVLAALVALLALPLAARADNPTSARASNTGPADTQSTIAPALPQPDVGPDAGPFAYLRAARVALATGQTGKAQQALEMAETRMLDRSTPLFQTNDPSRNPLVADISAARHALGAGDAGGAMSAIDQALALQHR